MSEKDKREQRALYRYSLLVLALAISVLFVALVRNFLQALLLAAILAGLFYPLFERLRTWTGRPRLASALTLCIVVLLLLIPLGGFATLMVSEAIDVSRDVMPWIEQHIEKPSQLESWLEQIPFGEHLTPYRGPIIQKGGEMVSQLGDYLIRNLAATTRGTATFFLNLFVMLYALFFFLADGLTIRNRILSYLPLAPSHQDRLVERFVSVTRATVKGNFLVGIIQGGLNGAAFALIGVPGTLVWTAVMSVLSFIPGVGSPVVWIPTVIYLFTIDRVGAALGLFVWGTFVVGLLDNVLRPRLVGRDTRLPDLLVLLGTLGGLIFLGPAGLIIGPIVAALFLTVWQLYGEAFKDLLSDLHSEDDTTDTNGNGENHHNGNGNSELASAGSGA